jgi:hypothetical protein
MHVMNDLEPIQTILKYILCLGTQLQTSRVASEFAPIVLRPFQYPEMQPVIDETS